MTDKLKTKTGVQPGDPDTTGHSWDGIQEFNNPLPRWWLWTFYATCVWAVLYTIAYPAWPLIQKATPGLLGYSTRAEVAADIAAVDAANAQINARLAAADLGAIADDPQLKLYATNAGAAVFRTWCAQCHGSGAAGARGYPNLLDDDWLWGGTVEEIHASIAHGIRNEEDPDARWSQMPAYGEILPEDEIAAVVQHVRSLAGQDHDATLAAAGSTIYMDNCAACHGDEGKGDRTQGAPNLTDAIWLYGGDVAAQTISVANARFGVMPPWNTRLDAAELAAVASYVHQLGGGE